MVDYSILVSALAGLGSFFSPCILPILPAFISYLAGNTINEVQNTANTNTKPSSVTISSSPAGKSSTLTDSSSSSSQENEADRIQSPNGSSRTVRELQEHKQQQQSSVTI